MKTASIIEQATTVDGEALGFNGELNEQERDDLEIEKTQLDIQKHKELKAIEVQVEEELDTQIRRRILERDNQKT